jgi:hypothetical protein
MKLLFHVHILSAILALSTSAAALGQTTISLFDGESLEGWSTPGGDPAPDGWEVADGAIHLAADRGRAGNIVTDLMYGDFELQFEWKIAKGGNSGIKYRVREFGNSLLGCEFQILDDDLHSDAQTAKKSTGSLYDLYAPNASKYLHPVGEYNQSRIIVSGYHLEHWLNGHQILTANVGSWDWYDKKAASKFSNVVGFGENRFGKIMLTDHNSDVWYRGLELTLLATTAYFTSVDSTASANSRCRPRRRLLRRRR